MEMHVTSLTVLKPVLGSGSYRNLPSYPTRITYWQCLFVVTETVAANKLQSTDRTRMIFLLPYCPDVDTGTDPNMNILKVPLREDHNYFTLDVQSKYCLAVFYLL
jgi:hypothetical protein